MPPPDKSKNEEADDFMQSLNVEHEESIVERKGRHFVEGEARFATVSALAELTTTVTTLARAQAENAIAMHALSKEFQSAAKDVATVKQWMEGTVNESGQRVPGFIDHIATFLRWKNWVLALLGAILTAQCIDSWLRWMDHASTIRTITHGGGEMKINIWAAVGLIAAFGAPGVLDGLKPNLHDLVCSTPAGVDCAMQIHILAGLKLLTGTCGIIIGWRLLQKTATPNGSSLSVIPANQIPVTIDQSGVSGLSSAKALPGTVADPTPITPKAPTS